MSQNPYINAFIWLVVMGVIFYVLWWFLAYIKLPEPFGKVAKVILALAGVIVVVNFLLSLIGYPLFHFG